MGSYSLFAIAVASPTALHDKFLPLSRAKRRSRGSSSLAPPGRISAVMRRREPSGASGGSGRRSMVDENMIVLRKRIREMEIAEQKYEPPTEWMEWERRCYASYSSVICDVMRMVQSGLMDTRPGIALGLAVVVTFSVPTTSAVLLVHLVEVVKGILPP